MVLITSSSYAAVKAGSACSKAGLKSISGGKTYTCTKIGKKLAWDNGVSIPVVKSSPSASPSPSVIEVVDPTTSAKSVFSDSAKCQLKSQLNHEANLGYAMAPTYVKSTGSINLAIIYTTYTDAPGDDRAFNEYDKVQFPNVASFFATASYGKIKVNLITNDKYYNINKSSESYNLVALNQTSNFAGVVADAVAAAKNDYDFSKIDSILVVMPSTSKAIDLGATGVFIQVGGNTINQSITAAYINPSDKTPVRPRFLVHEFGHNLGLGHPLAHDINFAWDVMNWEESPAADVFGWEKYILSWISASQVDCLSAIPDTPVTDYLESLGINSSNTKMLAIKLSESQLLVLESRRKGQLDELTSSEEGVLVYRVDVNLKSNDGAIKVISNGSPVHVSANGNRLVVGTIQQGESLTSNGVKITVLKQGASGDFVSVSKG